MDVIEVLKLMTLREIWNLMGGIMLQFIRTALPWLFAGALFMSGWHMGAKEERNHWNEVIHYEYIQKEQARKDTQDAVSAVSTHYQEEIAALEGSTDRIIDDLKRSNKRLSVRVKNHSCSTSGGTCRCIPDGRAELDERDAKRIIGVTQKGDAWIRALQDTIRELQKERKQ